MNTSVPSVVLFSDAMHRVPTDLQIIRVHPWNPWFHKFRAVSCPFVVHHHPWFVDEKPRREAVLSLAGQPFSG